MNEMHLKCNSFSPLPHPPILLQHIIIKIFLCNCAIHENAQYVFVFPQAALSLM